MSKARIEQYYREVENAILIGGSAKESTLRRYFANLVDFYAKVKKLTLVDEKIYINTNNQNKYPDGTLQLKGKNIGHWESKDTSDNLEKEILKKFEIGYPQYNILFENSETAILYQANNAFGQGKKVLEANMKNWRELDAILLAFVNYETEDIQKFKTALEQFTNSIPSISVLLKAIIAISVGEKNIQDFDTAAQLKISEAKISPDFIKKRNDFWQSCKKTLNPKSTLHDIDEMIIQHILTESIFNTVFGQAQFHKENNISYQVSLMIDCFFNKDLRSNTTDELDKYYEIILAEAQTLKHHQEKQRFLKLIYEEFYKAYNPQGADRLGIVYTPFEIIQFMLKATDYLLDKHFDHTLNDKDVKILDPCTGTGTFICDLIDYLGLQNLEYKYKNDIYANEVSILPYYIANLNIEHTFREKMGRSKAFENIAFIDTLDNLDGMSSGHLGEKASSVYAGQSDLFGNISEENSRRLHKQNKEKITVIIGNPPYNANQQNENDNNKNRAYNGIDNRIKATYIKSSTAQKTKLYDMYARFFRWASDRIPENGLVAFVTNRSYLDSRSFDGFRKEAAKDFQEIWILDTKSDVRANPKIAGTTHNVFGIQTGVCIAFLIKNSERADQKCKIMYFSLEDEMRKEEKLRFLASRTIKDVPFERIRPDVNGNWLNLTDNDFEDLIPICSKDKSEKIIFDFSSLGVNTARDNWVYDFDKKSLANKTQFFIKKYNELLKNNDSSWDTTIKWSEYLKGIFSRKVKLTFDKKLIVTANYRPFTKQFYYAEKKLSDRLTQNHYDIFGKTFDKANVGICFSGLASNKPFQAFVVDKLWSLDFLEKTYCLPFNRYTENGEKIENISDWALTLFRNHYEQSLRVSKTLRDLEKINIFHYVYAVLHNPEYRKKYEQNLKRDFPRIPLYADFWKWAEMGKKLMDLHLHYETVEKWDLGREEVKLKNPDAKPKAKLKADKTVGKIYIDDFTTLTGVPAQAWEYKLGNRSALEWILDQYKESTPSDATIAAQFNTYKFADYKEDVINLLMRVCHVSVETMQILGEMGEE